MNSLFIAVSLIRRINENKLQWLVRWNHEPEHYSFIVGSRLENETYRESITREVAWQLGLDRNKEFLVSNMATLNLEFIDQLPGQCSPHHIAVSFYPVDLYRESARTKVANNNDLVWANSDEICSGLVNDNQPFDPMMLNLIRRSGVIQSWDSQ